MLPDGWKNGKLGDLCTFKGGFGFKEIHQGHEKGDLPFIKVSDMNRAGNEVHINSSNNWISHDQKREMRVKTFPPHSIVFAKVGAALLLNRRRILSRDTIIDNNMMAAVSKTTCYYNYLFYILSAIDFGKFVQEGAVPSINQGDLSSFKISYPPLPEQKKIAAILSTWDRAIEGTEKLLANSQQQKKALMQQLLTGKKRLPGFTEEWKTVAFRNIGKCIRGVTYKPDDLDAPQSYVLLRANNIQNGKISYSDTIKVDSKIVKTEKILSNGDIFICMANGSKNLVGKSAYYFGEKPTKTVGSFCSIFRTNKSNSPRFIFSLFESTFYRDKIEIILSGTSINNLKPSDIEEMSWFIPPLPEQKAIAAVLTTADEEITALKSDLSRLRQEKKALMQQLLTGKRRVKVD